MRYLLWDFDGTLANRKGMWTGALHDALVQVGIRRDLTEIRLHLSSGFPWHTPEVEHYELDTAEAWWASLLPLLQRTAIALGAEEQSAGEVALAAKANYLDPTSWELAPAVIRVLSDLQHLGWHSVIISNHVPELPDIVKGLGLREYFERVFCSAALGVEKPHPAFFNQVLSALPPGVEAWVIGDSVAADIKGANAAGLRSILIGGNHPLADYCVASVAGVPEVLKRARAFEPLQPPKHAEIGKAAFGITERPA